MTAEREGQPPERRVALVIGNASYRVGPPLANPATDAAEIAAALKRLDFDPVDMHIDLDKPGHDRALKQFAVRAKTADMAIVYYAGHGMEIDGENYLLPVDAELSDVSSVGFETTRLSDLMRAVDGADRFRFVILDACRDNPFRRLMHGIEGTRSMLSRGLAAPPDGGGNTLVAYAACHGTQAKDGKQGSNSPFAAALLRHIETPNTDIRIVIGRVRDDVSQMTAKQQVPAIYGSMGGTEIQLKRVVSAPTPPPMEGEIDALVKGLQQERDWEKAQRADTVEAYQNLLATWSSGRFSEEAQHKIDAHNEAAEFKTASTAIEAEALRGFLARWPEGQLKDRAQALIDDRTAQTTWDAAIKDKASASSMSTAFDAEALRNFVVTFPKSKFGPQIKARLVSAEAEHANAFAHDPVPDAYRRYLKHWPDGGRRTEAERLLAGDGDEVFWAKVQKDNSVAIVQRYRAAWPEGKHIAEAEKLERKRRNADIAGNVAAGLFGLGGLALALFMAYGISMVVWEKTGPVLGALKTFLLAILPDPKPEPSPASDRDLSEWLRRSNKSNDPGGLGTTPSGIGKTTPSMGLGTTSRPSALDETFARPAAPIKLKQPWTLKEPKLDDFKAPLPDKLQPENFIRHHDPQPVPSDFLKSSGQSDNPFLGNLGAETSLPPNPFVPQKVPEFESTAPAADQGAGQSGSGK